MGDIPQNRHSTVAIARCLNYEIHNVKNSILATLEPLGGMENFVCRGDHVHIKPNILSAQEPEKAITTHPTVVQTVAELVKQAGGQPVIGDSPGGAVHGITRYWEKTGLKEVAETIGAKLISLEQGGVVERKYNGRSYFLSKPVLDADVIINLPKLKTHDLLLMTGAVKNMFGVIPGMQKAMLHKAEPKPELFSELVVDVFSLAQPQLTIMDAVVGMEGNGPSGGTPKNVGLVLASPDAVALDTIAAYLIGFRPFEILTNKIAMDRGLSVASLDQITIFGEELEQIKINDFKLPSNRLLRLIPESIAKFGSRFFWSRPQVIPSKCTSCGMCEKSCPVKAIERNTGIPMIEYDRCINCLCCDEVCPENAIEIAKSWMAKIFL